MNFFDYLKDKITLLIINISSMLILSIFLLLIKNTGTAIFLIDVVWAIIIVIYFFIDYYFRRKYFKELMTVLNELPQKYLIAEVMKPSYKIEDRLYWEILRKSNKSVIEEIHKLEVSQKEYKEYIESWIHEVKLPITAAHLICENNKEDFTKRIMLELDEIENEVEKILYYVRMEQVYKDYLIHTVDLKEIVLAAISTEKRHLIQCGLQINLEMENTIVSTDEKWVEFILKQIFTNSMKYKKEVGARLKIYIINGNKQKSLIIEDNGCGIAEEDIGRIFDKGFTGKNGRKDNNNATGMGLYLAKKLCEKLEIGISCESEHGKFTRMILTFPDSDFLKIQK